MDAANTTQTFALTGLGNSQNFIAFYEKGPVGVRLAYNWRSDYLTANLDCCIGLPVFQKAAGFLDGSVRYSIGSHVEVSLDATNLWPEVSRQSVWAYQGTFKVSKIRWSSFSGPISSASAS